jgi:hypothetical protein
MLKTGERTVAVPPASSTAFFLLQTAEIATLHHPQTSKKQVLSAIPIGNMPFFYFFG